MSYSISMLAASTRLGPYEIAAPLGAGGMGVVYRARDTRLDRDVAIKVLPDAFAADPNRLARFEREAKAVAALSHPNILAIHDYGTHESITYAVMELLEGETLRSRLAKGALPWREAVEVATAIADGLAAAHAKGIIHRDLKPENLFLMSAGGLKILDFGLARMAPPASQQSETGPYVPAQTDPGTIMGTASYMSPEQVRGQPADARSDIFSFGCVLYEMVAGRRAFQHATAADTMSAILRDEPPDLAASGQQVPAALGRLIRQCLAKNPDERIQAARALARGLRDAQIAPALAGDRGPGRESTEPKDTDRSAEAVAVLPFENVGGNPNTEYLSDGVADHLIISLSQTRRAGLKVRPFSSVSRYKRQRADAPTIGQELNVQALVTGTLHQVGDDLWISVAVVDAREDNQLWGKRYQGKLGGILDLQDQIARDVATNLRLHLTSDEERRLTKRYTEDPDAYLLYREARYHFNKFTETGLDTSIDYCRRALKKDPNYSLAYSGLGHCYFVLGAVHRGFRDNYAEARTALDRALALDDSLAEAHAGLAALYLMHDWNWPAAKRELDRAIALNPDLPVSWELYGFYHAAMGRSADALASVRRSPELDPHAAPGSGILAMCYNWTGQYDQAAATARRLLDLEPNYPFSYREIAIAYVHQGETAQAIAELQAALSRGNTHPRVRGILGYAYAKAGRKADAQRVIQQLKEEGEGRFAFAHAIAQIYAAFGDNDEAFAWLQRACDERDSALTWLKVEPTLENLRSDPRFARLLRTMALPVEEKTQSATPDAVPSSRFDRLGIGSDQNGHHTRQWRRLLIWPLAALVLAGLVGAAAYFLRQSKSPDAAPKSVEPAKAIDAVAVLPFENITGDPEAEHLSGGIPDTIIHTLSRVRQRDLKVRPFTSVARYKGKKPDVREVGRDLGVGAMVTGRLEQRGNRLALSVELIDIRDENVLWGKQYDRPLAEILALQDELARDLAASLRLSLTGEEERRLTRRATNDPEAFQLYLKGRYFWEKRSIDGINKAIAYFRLATDKDPAYALAYSGLADCYVIPSHPLPPRERMPRAKAAALKALDLDDNLAEAHTTLARVLSMYEWDWSAAEKEFKRAIDLNPNYPVVHQWYGGYWQALGRNDRSIAERKRALDLDPLSLAINFELGLAYYYAGDHDRAIQQFRRTMEMDGSFPPVQPLLPLMYEEKGRYDEAISGFKKAIEVTSGSPFDHAVSMAGLGHAYAVSGNRDEALKVLNELKQRADQEYVPAIEIARIYAGLGDKDRALEWLEKAYEERSFLIVYVKADPSKWDSLRADPRFGDLLWRLGLADKPAPIEAPFDTLAVLPFENQSTDPAAGYLGDDSTFSLTESLGRFRDLKVRSFSSASRFKDKSKTAVAAGKELQVSVVLSGTIQKRGDGVVIFVELVDVRSDQPLWKQRYEGEFAERLVLQRDIVQDIPDKLRLALAGDQKQALAKMPTQNLQAHELYVHGRIEFGKRTPESLQKALELYDAAIKLDPNFALAYSGKADVYQVQFIYANVPYREAMQKAKAAAEKALALDPSLAEATISLAHVKGWNDWDFPAALELFRKGVQLKPNYATGRHWYGEFLSVMGRHDEAVEQFRLAIQLDPDSPVIRADLAAAYRFVRKYDEAIGELNTILAKNAAYTNAHAILGVTLLQRAGKQQEHLPAAIKELQEAVRLSGGYGFAVVYLAAADALSGDQAAARKTLAEYTAAPPTERAVIHLALVERDKALAELERSYREKDGLLVYAKVDPFWDSLQNEPRFQALIKKMNFPP